MPAPLESAPPPTSAGLSLDWVAVIVAFALAALVRAGLLRSVPW